MQTYLTVFEFKARQGGADIKIQNNQFTRRSCNLCMFICKLGDLLDSKDNDRPIIIQLILNLLIIRVK